MDTNLGGSGRAGGSVHQSQRDCVTKPRVGSRSGSTKGIGFTHAINPIGVSQGKVACGLDDRASFTLGAQPRWGSLSPIPIAVLRSPAMVTSICNFSPEPGKNTPLVVLLLIASMAGGVDNG